MSKNINQIYVANPITSNAQTDLMYFGQSPYGVGDDAAMLYSKFVAPFQAGQFNNGVDTGAVDAYEVDLTPAIASLTDGLTISFVVANSNTITAPTLDVNSLGAKTIFGFGFVPVPVGALSAGAISTVYYDSSIDVFVLTNSAVNSGVTGDELLGGQGFFYSNGGPADAYDVTSNIFPTVAPNSGTLIIFDGQPNATATPTIKVNGGMPLDITLVGGGALSVGDIDNNVGYAFCYYFANLQQVVLLNPLISANINPSVIQKSTYNVGTDIGVADAYEVNLSPTVGSYTNGLEVTFTPANTNLTIVPTLALNGLAATSITRSNGPVSIGDISSASIAKLIYSQQANVFILLTPAT